MLITCPTCSTSYEVPDESIGEDGRTVRCAKCRESWFQEGSSAGAIAASSVVDTPVYDDHDHTLASGADSESAQTPDNEETAAPAPVAENHTVYSDLPEEEPYTQAAGYADEEAGSFEPTRQGHRTLWVALTLFVVIALAIGAALARFGAPDWLPLSQEQTPVSEEKLTLNFPTSQQELHTLADGTPYFAAYGVITNVSNVTQKVPLLEVVLHDSSKREVYRWDVLPPRDKLAPGESMTVGQSVTDIPQSASNASIGWKRG